MPELSTITFYIKLTEETRTYTAEQGMTWSAFIKSSYNKDKFREGSGVILAPDPIPGFATYNGATVKPTDTIISGAEYVFMSS